MKTRINLYQSILFFALLTLSFVMTGHFLQTNQSVMSENQTLNVSGKDINWKSNELIDLDDLKALDTSSYLLIDLRPQEDFLLGHLDGALSLPSNSLLKNDLSNLIKTKKLIVLCSATVHQSLETFLLLQELGANDTRILSINASSKQTGDPFQNYKVESQAAFGDRYAIAQRPVKKPKRIQRTNSVPKEKINTTPKKKKRLPEGGC